MGLLLTDAERLRFADYLALEAETSDSMAGVLEKDPNPATTALAKKFRMEAMAAKIIEERLRSGETFTVQAG